MKAAIIDRFGTPEVLRIAEMPLPVPTGEQVLVRVAAAGLNPVDTKIRAGSHLSSGSLQFPAVLGKEISGTVAEPDASGIFREGDEVFGFLPANGGFAEYAIAGRDLLVKKPANVSFSAASAVSLAGLTAYQALHDHLELTRGQHVLIQAAAGGVGHLAVQLAKEAGAHVSGTASGRNIAFLEKLGADRAIDYKKERFEEVAGDPDAVLDAMGGEVLYRSIGCVRPGGRVVCLPSSTKDDPRAIALAAERKVRLIWPMMHPEREQLLLLASLLEAGRLRVEVSRVFPLEEIAEAHRAVESHGTRGKNVIMTGPEDPS